MSSTENSDVSVVILTKNSARTIEPCLKSVIQEKPGEILAVDRFSTDGTLNILKRYGVTVRVDQMGSIGYSRRLGVEAAKGDFVMFVDSDVELKPGCIMRLRYELDKYGWAGIHTKVLSRETGGYWERAEAEGYSSFNTVGPVHGDIPMLAALFRKEVLLRYPFDPSFSESGEDNDLCRRLREKKYRLGVSTAIAYHHPRGQLSEIVRQRFRYGLGDARLGLKYKSIRISVKPSIGILLQVIYCIVSNKTNLIPYWLTSGLAQLTGALVGISSPDPRRQTS